MILLKERIGKGIKIMMITLPFIVTGLILNFLFLHFLSVDAPSERFNTISFIILFFGIIIWLCSVVRMLIKLPIKEFISYGPYAFNKHPIYIGVAFLVLPWPRSLLNSLLGVVIGIALYLLSRVYFPKEEAMVAENYDSAWDQYV